MPRGVKKSIVKVIREKKGHYVLGLKRNQKKLYTSAQDPINAIGQSEKNCLCDTFDERYGRTVRRRYFGYKSASVASSEWADAKSIVAVETIGARHKRPVCIDALAVLSLGLYSQSLEH
jgi:hypothetical protein